MKTSGAQRWARNREMVCDYHRNPEPQACAEHSSHQETFERKERRDRGVESNSQQQNWCLQVSQGLTRAGDESRTQEVEVGLCGGLGLWSSVTRGGEVSQLVRCVFETFWCTMVVASLEH